ncbi:unnamed protein product [Schistosoma curassoni]|uniref:UTRA domain-containing protein n=1 Tax=Schistosoma curassoni TaxID=6186 RepID=A0A183K1P8_9TREM|nr:unnamed protein product [Schistosoma curassoni]
MLDPDFVLLGTRQQGVPLILREVVLPDGFDPMEPGFRVLATRQQGVPVILRELVLPGGFDLVSHSFTVRDVTTELSEKS